MREGHHEQATKNMARLHGKSPHQPGGMNMRGDRSMVAPSTRGDSARKPSVNLPAAAQYAANAIHRAGENMARGMRPIGIPENRQIRNAIGETNPIDKLYKGIGSRIQNPRGK